MNLVKRLYLGGPSRPTTRPDVNRYLAQKRGISLSDGPAGRGESLAAATDGDVAGATLENGPAHSLDVGQITQPTVEGLVPDDTGLRMPTPDFALMATQADEAADATKSAKLNEELAADAAESQRVDSENRSANAIRAAGMILARKDPSFYQQQSTRSPNVDASRVEGDKRRAELEKYLMAQRQERQFKEGLRAKAAQDANALARAEADRASREKIAAEGNDTKMDIAKLPKQFRPAGPPKQSLGEKKLDAAKTARDEKAQFALAKALEPHMAMMNIAEQLKREFEDDPEMSGVGIGPTIGKAVAGSYGVHPFDEAKKAKALRQMGLMGALRDMVRKDVTGVVFKPSEQREIEQQYGLGTLDPKVVRQNLPLFLDRLQASINAKRAGVTKEVEDAYLARGGAFGPTPGTSQKASATVVIRNKATGQTKSVSADVAQGILSDPKYEVVR